jgi:DNA (cytosine-5)-methyltransferase 1
MENSKSTKPCLLDAFCGEGGTAEGFRRAGWYVVGVDMNANAGKRYAGHEFHHGDALEFIREHGADFDAVHAGPPCQGYTIGNAGNPEARAKWPTLIEPVRGLLQGTGRPYVIENVEQARKHMCSPILLCGRMFGLSALDEDGEKLVLERHRLFESNVALRPPVHPAHDRVQVAGVYGGAARVRREPGETLAEVAPRDRFHAKHVRHGGYVPRSKRVQQDLLGIDWMTLRGMQESIPPAYSEYIGKQLLSFIGKGC